MNVAFPCFFLNNTLNTKQAYNDGIFFKHPVRITTNIYKCLVQLKKYLILYIYIYIYYIILYYIILYYIILYYIILYYIILYYIIL